MKPGKTNNPNGRPKGSPNKVTAQLRSILKDVIADELERLPETMEGLDPKERLDVLIKLIPFCMPKVNPVGMSAGEPFSMADMGMVG